MSLERFQLRLRISLRVHLLVRLLDLSLRVDDVGDAFRVSGGSGLRCAVGEADFPIGVAEEREVERELGRERLVVLLVVEGDAEDHGVLPVVLGLEVAEPATFGRSARGFGLRVEPENDGLAAVVPEALRLPRVVFDLEVRRPVAHFQHSLPPARTYQKPFFFWISQSLVHLRNVPYACSRQTTRPAPPSRNPPCTTNVRKNLQPALMTAVSGLERWPRRARSSAPQSA